MIDRIQQALQLKYPGADFSIYFRHLAACNGTKQESGRTHEHHICPRKQFPELEHAPDNLITLTIDDHDFAHKLLEAACGIKAPNTAWMEAQRVGSINGGRVGGPIAARICKENGTGIFARKRAPLLSRIVRLKAELGITLSRAEVAHNRKLREKRKIKSLQKRMRRAARTAQNNAIIHHSLQAEAGI